MEPVVWREVDIEGNLETVDKLILESQFCSKNILGIPFLSEGHS